MNDKTLIAQELARMGRYGDTMLAHINPQEAALLKMMGGAGTINPYTGLPEFFSFKKAFKKVVSVVKKVVKAVAPVLPIIVAVFAPELIPALGSEILGTSAAAAGIAETAAGAAAISAATTAATGGNIEQIAKNAATAAISAGVSGNVSSAVNTSLVDSGVNATVAKVVSNTVAAAASASATGGDVSKAITTAALVGGATAGYNEIFSTPPQLTDVEAPTTPTEAAATVDTTKPVDYSLTAGATFPGEGLKAPELAPLPAAETIGQTPIDYGNLFTPTTPSIGYQAPKLQQLPPTEQIGVKPIDYENILTPETRNLPSMGGGTGLTATSEEATPIQVAPQETSPLKQAGEAATRYLASDYASSLFNEQPSRSASTLTSTGLFSPTSIVPTALTGIAPVGRGKPIFGEGEDEATGTWGSKTLRG